MTDFDRLDPQVRAILLIKLDGHVEAAVHAARALDIGLAEALEHLASAVLREFFARGLDRDAAHRLFTDAADRTWPAPPVPMRFDG